MAWVNAAPTFLVPLLLLQPCIFIAPIPQTPLLAVVSASTVVVYDLRNLLPLGVHRRLDECMAAHGPSVAAQVRHVSVDTAKLDRLSSVNLYVRTSANYVLIYHVFVNYAKSLYEICDEQNGDTLLQNALPLANTGTRNSLSSILKNATMSILTGTTLDATLQNIEHFHSVARDDEDRNDAVPLAKLTLYKILKLSSQISDFWCKSNSQNLIFANADNVQLLNMKTFNSELIVLADYPWFTDTVLLEYDLNHNFFLHVDSKSSLSILEFVASDNAEVSLKHTHLLNVDYKCQHVYFNPQFDLVVLQSATALKIYRLSVADAAHPHKLTLIKDLYTYEQDNVRACRWSPCGTFLVVIHADHSWKMISRFGYIFFDSTIVQSELAQSNVNAETIEELTEFCSISNVAFTANGQHLILVDKDSAKLHFLDLLRLGGLAFPLFYDETYISMPDPEGASFFARTPIPPAMQAVISKYHFINGISDHLSTKKPTGHIAIGASKTHQLSVSYGNQLAISTPTKLANESNHVFWYQFYNHYLESMNIVSHFWIDDFLVLINRYQHDDSDDDHESVTDELVIVNTSESKYGSGGGSFVFDSDLIVWRHSFENRVINFELIEDTADSKTLVLITSDLKIIMMEVKTAPRKIKAEKGALGKDIPQIAIKVRRTIHLSSIKHKLPITRVQKLAVFEDRHFFFLLNTGELFLLKNQIEQVDQDMSSRHGPIQTKNMYDLIQVAASVESIQVNVIDYGHDLNTYLTLFNGEQVRIYNIMELVERTYEFQGVERSSEVDVQRALKPIEVQITSFLPLKIFQNSGSIEASGFRYQILAKSDNLILKHSGTRQLILNRFIFHDLFEAGESVDVITKKYSQFGNFEYCLELLLFESLEDQADNVRLKRVIELVDTTDKADFIYVNFLRKIEVKYWDSFFELLDKTPVGFMNRLIESRDVELCYNYLNVYLNFKREVEGASTPFADDSHSLLGQKDRKIITQIIEMLGEAQKWDECFELCRFIKLLEPLGEFLRELRKII